jgi:hypothetical protein
MRAQWSIFPSSMGYASVRYPGYEQQDKTFAPLMSFHQLYTADFIYFT